MQSLGRWSWCAAALVLAGCPRTEVQGVGLLAPPEDGWVAAGPLEVLAQARGAAAASLRLDGVEVATTSVPACAGTAAFELSAAELAPGPHRLVLESGGYRVHRRIEALGPRAIPNRVEAAATPRPFACLGVVTRTDRGLELEVGRAPQSNGLDPGRDLVLAGLDGAVSALGRLACAGDPGARTCTASDPGERAVARLELVERGARAWRLRLEGGLASSAGALWLRVGHDQGGLELASARRLDADALALDVEHRAEATVGPEGAVLRTTDARGTALALMLPPGSLTSPVRVRLTPLLGAALLGAGAAERTAVQLEPDGLELRVPGRLRVELPAVAPLPAARERVGLLTSPVAVAPVPSAVDGRSVEATLWHFSTYVVGDLGPYAVWADEVLAAADQPTLSELHTIEAQYVAQQLEGCEGACLGLDELKDLLEAALQTLSEAACAEASQAPSIAVAQKLVALKEFADRNNVGAARVVDCAHAALQKLVAAAGARARSSDPVPPRTDRTDPLLLELLPDPAVDACHAPHAVDLARCLAFDDVEQQARDLVEAALVARAGRMGVPQTLRLDDPTLARAREIYLAGESLAMDRARDAGLRKVSEGLRFWLDSGKRLCAQGNPTGKELLKKAEAWVTTLAPAVLGVDPPLGSAISGALAGCVVCTVELSPTYASAAVGDALQLSARVLCVQDQRVTWRISPVGATVSNGTFVATRGGQYTVTAVSVANPAILGTASISVDCVARDFVGTYPVDLVGFVNNGPACPGSFTTGTLSMELVDAGVNDQVVARFNYAGFTPDGGSLCETYVQAQLQGCSLAGMVGPSYCQYVEFYASLYNGKLDGNLTRRTGPIPCVTSVSTGFVSR